MTAFDAGGSRRGDGVHREAPQPGPVSSRRRVPAMGGERSVPAPDPIAEEYLLLALRLGQRIDGLVDAYFGPADLKATADTEQLRSPEGLIEDARGLRDRVGREVAERDRRGWLDAQVAALETHALVLAGETFAYADLIRSFFATDVPRRDDGELDAVASRLDGLLPGAGAIGARLAAWDDRFTIPADRVASAAERVVAHHRALARGRFYVPAAESLRLAWVRRRPWAAYNWYEGGGRSRIDVNLDLPVRAPRLLRLLAHEAFPGHHLEHAAKEERLVEGAARVEASILLINTPECLVSEGLADAGYRFVADDEEELLAEILDATGIGAGPQGEPNAPRDRGTAAGQRFELARRAAAIERARAGLEAAAINAAYLRHVDGASHDDVLEYLVEAGRMAPDRAAKRLEFIEHPLWRAYVVVYAEGARLVDAWMDRAADGEPPTRETTASRFERLLTEQITPLELASDGDDHAAGSGRVDEVSGPTTTR